MFNSVLLILLWGVVSLVLCQPLEGNKSLESTSSSTDAALKRSLFDQLINIPKAAVEDITRDLTAEQDKPRFKRQSEEECEKLELCMLHARSRHSFFYAFEQYFVNKENARLWDHHARSVSECHRRFRSCYR